MGIFEASTLILGVLVWGTTINNNVDCAGLGQSHCGQVFGCYWNSTNEISDLSATYPIYTTGGRCLKDPCLRIVGSTVSCGDYYQSGTRNCQETGSGSEHWCSQYSAGDYVDCSNSQGTSCQNSSKSLPVTEKLCYVQPNLDYCALNVMLNGGPCQSGLKTILGETGWLNCREYDVGGVKTCKAPGGCEAHGIENCTYFPDCMVVDGQCVADNCFSLSYSNTSHACNNPERCSGHQFKTAWYNFKYQSESGGSRNRSSYERHYTYSIYCTNIQYNSNPNTYYPLSIIGEGAGGSGSSSSITVIDYLGEDGLDRCAVSRDFCQWCSKFKVDSSECTGAGGVVKNVDGTDICTDGRENSAAFALRLPSASMLLVFVLLLIFN